MQNIAGTKYMTANITGGIANILTGHTNIGMERLAREYFNEGEYARGAAIYFGGTISYFAGMYSDKATSLQDGIIKVANIIDYDRINLIEVLLEFVKLLDVSVVLYLLLNLLVNITCKIVFFLL